ncbi:metallophosphoesterase [Pseudoruegeria sp. SK021]|uniref:metallophosphoesterase family protein n=1 Tax=Pseudoruegeria sp. SK021 TaxID=1933035 RepID=UPI000A243C3B|nr:metallophosphoesterase family protein [Pseudoruegeria sp. SK021]OSP55238.1 diadenosine tetraphosphatase [Pseudoruegeria sp. SK021]
MKQRWIDLGDLGARALVFGGACSNFQATQALYRCAAELGFTPSQIICTGDTVAYCADPVATVGLIRQSGGPVIAGNCERQLADGAGTCGCGFAPGSTCDRLSMGWFAHADRLIDADTRDWMAALPEFLVMTVGGRRCAVLHGGATDISRFLWPDSCDQDFMCEIDAIRALVGPVDTVLAGHSGVAFHRRVEGIDWINAGAIGIPPHDGGPDTRYASISADGPVFHRLSYDARIAAMAMTDAGLTQGYEATLMSGIWPSEEVLPASLHRDATIQRIWC